MAKIIKIPPPVKADFKALQQGVIIDLSIEYSFPNWLIFCMDSYSFKGREQARVTGKIAEKLESVNGDPTITLDDAWIKILADVTEAQGWLGGAIRRFAPFYDALEKAEDVKG